MVTVEDVDDDDPKTRFMGQGRNKIAASLDKARENFAASLDEADKVGGALIHADGSGDALFAYVNKDSKLPVSLNLVDITTGGILNFTPHSMENPTTLALAASEDVTHALVEGAVTEVRKNLGRDPEQTVPKNQRLDHTEVVQAAPPSITPNGNTTVRSIKNSSFNV